MIPISDQPGPRHRFPIVMLAIVVTNVLVFLLEIAQGEALQDFVSAFGVVPLEYTTGRDIPPQAPGPIWVTLFTSMWLHGGFLHIAGNMLYLWVFGDNVEDRFGHVGFLLFYLASGVAAGLAHIFVNPQSSVPSIGASGAIAGVLAAYIVLFPQSQVRTLLFVGPFITMTRVSAFLLLGVWFVLQFLSGLAAIAQAEQTGGVAFWAHIGGFVFGLLVTLALRGTLAPRRQEGWY